MMNAGGYCFSRNKKMENKTRGMANDAGMSNPEIIHVAPKGGLRRSARMKKTVKTGTRLLLNSVFEIRYTEKSVRKKE